MLNFASLNSPAPQSGTTTRREDLPKANAWLNLGYEVEVLVRDAEGKEATETRFVSIPVGIPLDTMDPINITTRNTEFAQLQAAQNDLLQQLKDLAAGRNPGDALIVPLQVQLRRVNGPAQVPAADASNPFAGKLDLASGKIVQPS